MQKKVKKKEFTGIHQVFSTNVEDFGNYVSNGDIINKNCVIDYDYEGEIHINLLNCSNNNVVIRAGEKIVQFVRHFQPIMTDVIEYSSKEELYKGTDSKRGEGGFGSSGIK